MANTKSTLVTNEDAEPVVFNHVGLQGARTRSIVATVESTGTDADTYILCKLHPEWRIMHIWLTNDASSGGTDWDIGLVSDTSATAISAAATACYADGISIASARTSAPADMAFGGGTNARAIEKMGQFVYQDAGHTESNKLGAYYLAMKGNTAGAASKTIVVNVQFTVD